jgi:hypothetical protein
MTQDTPHAAGPAFIRTRLQRLRELVALQADSDWGRSYVQEILDQDPDEADSHCPRFAGLVEESGEYALVVAETIADLAYDMAARVTNEIPMSAIEMIDLDTQEHHPADTEATVRFIGAGQPDTPADAVGNSPPPRFALRVVVDESPDVSAERTIRASYLDFDEIANTLGLSREAAHAVIAGLQEGVPYSEKAGDAERVYLIPAAAIPPPGVAR